jgi:hypothetical protein
VSDLFTMRMTTEERAELDLLVKEGGFRSAAAALKWLVSVHVDRDCMSPCEGQMTVARAYREGAPEQSARLRALALEITPPTEGPRA